MRTQNKHAHAYTEYDLVSWKHYIKLLVSVVECKLRRYKSLTVHLPFEVQHSQYCGCLDDGLDFIKFGERLKKIFRVKLYWENAPWLKYGTWDLKYDNTNWSQLIWAEPTIEICLDTGHLMLRAKDIKDARYRINKIMKKWGSRIRHLHLHENDFRTDQHDTKSRKVLNKRLIEKLIKGRTYIWEKGE